MMRSFLKFCAAGIALGLLTLGAGWLGFLASIPGAVADTTTKTDAIVVLTGGSGRIEAGIELLQQGFAGRLFISGAGGQTRIADLVPDVDQLPPEAAAAIALGREAEDTPGNAVETAAWVARENIRSIRIVTAAYHMPRSLMEMHAAMPAVSIIAHPVFPSNVKPDWWRWRGTANLLASEYLKSIATRLRIVARDIVGGGTAS